jgi:DNA repair protein RAD5
MDGSSPPPPPKKRRFFKDDLDDEPTTTSTEIAETTGPPTPVSRVSTPPKSPPPQSPAPPFADQLRAILGVAVLAPSITRALEDASGGNVERAVNMYFDGLWETQTAKDKPRGLMVTDSGKKPYEPTLTNFLSRSTVPVQRKKSPKTSNSSSSSSCPWIKRYLGSFGVEGWASSSGTNLVQAGSQLVIERQSPRSSTQSSLKLPTRLPIPGKQGGKHHLVRFTSPQGKEIGRLPHDIAVFVSSLLEQKICSFDGEVIYCPEKLRTGDNILIQLRCYLLPHIFDSVTSSGKDRPGTWEVAETDEERELKLRRLSLLQLFQHIGLDPLGGPPKPRDQVLLAAQPVDPVLNSTALSRTSSQSEDEEDTIAQDTLNALYKKAQMYDPEMRDMDPAKTFRFELRKYQKQALCWMVGKEEGGNQDVRKQESLNPLWEEYEWPQEEPGPREKFYMNPYSGEMSLTIPTYQSMHKGGILADGIISPFQLT